MLPNNTAVSNIERYGSGDLHELIEHAREAERKGQSAEARAAYERALYSLSPADAPSLASDLARWIARTHAADGDLEAGIDCAGLALAIAEACGSSEALAYALNVLATLRLSRGDLDEATFLYKRAETRAKEIRDVQLVATIQLNLGTISNILGEFEAALGYYRDILTGFRAIALEDYVGYVLNNMGMLYTDLSRWAEAEESFSAALDSCDRSNSTSTRAMVLVNLAELLVLSGRMDEAEEVCASGWEVVSGFGDVRTRAELSKVHGILLRERGQIQEADEYLGRAAETARERGDVLLEAEVLREQAALFSLQERHRETLHCLNRSHQLFTQLRARKDIADLDGKILQLEQTFLAIVRRWGESIESADRYTQGHCVRVADYACALARRAGMDDATLLWFRMGALLHDVGKIVIPSEVLNKPGGFTPEERQLMERHPDAGVELLGDIEFPWDIRPMVRFHHERWSGGGYPTGIAGESIPLSARILCIADVFDALSTDRPYRPAMPVEKCLEIMSTSMGGHFDPQLLEIFIGLCREGVTAPPVSAAPPEEAVSGANAPGVLLLSAYRSPWEMRVIADAWSGGVRCIAPQPWGGAGAPADAQLPGALLLLLEEMAPDPLGEVARVRESFPELPMLVVLERENEELALGIIQKGAQEVLVRRKVEPVMLEQHVRRSVERARLQRDLQVQSLRDDLTGLFNRRGFHALAVRRVSSSLKDHRPVLFFADLDGLKQINDTLGHAEGDRALMEMAGVLRSIFRENDVIARLSGDEFAVLVQLPVQMSETWLAQRIQEQVAQRNAMPGRRYRLSVSVGTAVGGGGAEQTIEDMLARADATMYTVKRQRTVGRAPGGRLGAAQPEAARSVIIM